jgi:hypothetical protein
MLAKMKMTTIKRQNKGTATGAVVARQERMKAKASYLRTASKSC